MRLPAAGVNVTTSTPIGHTDSGLVERRQRALSSMGCWRLDLPAPATGPIQTTSFKSDIRHESYPQTHPGGTPSPRSEPRPWVRALEGAATNQPQRAPARPPVRRGLLARLTCGFVLYAVVPLDLIGSSNARS